MTSFARNTLDAIGAPATPVPDAAGLERAPKIMARAIRCPASTDVRLNAVRLNAVRLKAVRLKAVRLKDARRQNNLGEIDAPTKPVPDASGFERVLKNMARAIRRSGSALPSTERAL
jgi:hypothetical protein